MTHAFNNPRWEQERKARMGRVSGWQTIDSAPDTEDGVLIVDAAKPSPAVGVARLVDGEWRGYDHGYGVECIWPTPTHWMPLPQPPQG